MTNFPTPLHQLLADIVDWHVQGSYREASERAIDGLTWLLYSDEGKDVVCRLATDIVFESECADREARGEIA